MGIKGAGQSQRSRRERPVIDIYARLSHAPTGETIKVDDQAEMGQEALERRGGVLGEVFKDPSKSAWDPGVVRPEWERLMGRLESGESDGVWVYDLTRFSRKVMEGERLVELAARGIRVWSNAGEYDLATADGRAHFREAMVAAARESDKISERVKRGKLRRARRGRHHGGPRAFAIPGWAPVGPDWEQGDPRERVSDETIAAERAVVRECYDRLFAGQTMAVLARDLNERGSRTTTGKVWNQASLRGMLIRASLAGLIEHDGQFLGERLGVEAIVSREELLRMRAMFAARHRGRPPGMGSHILAGLARCADCGQPFYGMPRPRSKPYPDGSVRREYRCRRDIRLGGCGRNGIDALTAETIVGEAVKARLADPRRVDRVAARLVAVKGERARIGAEIARLEQDADGLAEKVAAWGMDRVERAMQPIQRRLDELNEQLAELEEPETADAAAADAVKAWDDARAAGDTPALRAMIKRAFPRLAVKPPAKWGDHSADRFDWDGESLAPLRTQPLDVDAGQHAGRTE
jgi:site-specific DNA recombinase